MLNLKTGIQTIKITADPESYSTFIYGPAKIGKSTLVKHLYGKHVLFLETEPRDRALVGADVAHVTNWIDFVSALSQLKRSKELHKRYKVIAVDTVDNLVRFVEDYTKEHFQEKELGDNVSFGKDYKFAKDQWNKYVTSIHDIGYTPIYVGHSKTATATVEADKASKDNIEGNVKELRQGNQVFYQFKQAQPDLPTKYWNPLNKSVDQILYLSSMLSSGKEKRVIYLRKTAQHIAGSTFPNIKPVLPLDAKEYRKAMKDAVNYYDKKDQTKEDYNKPSKGVDFKNLMSKAKQLGFKVAKSGHIPELKKIVADTFGPDNKLMEAQPEQYQQVEAAMMKMRKLV